jgi:hypothetical protein|tara:strand:+ start:362 stop:523 length:162 start_codon:yes stop_codon:yes gene_type:complete
MNRHYFQWYEQLSVIWPIPLLNHYSFIGVYVDTSERKHEEEIVKIFLFLEHTI